KTASSKLADVTLMFRASSLNVVSQSNSVKLSSDGSFRITGVPRGIGTFYLAPPIPKGIYLSRIELDGVEQKYGIEVGAYDEISGVKIVMLYGGGSIRGEARIEGERAANSFTVVFLRKRNNDPDRQQTGVGMETNDRGRFYFDGLTPGDYDLTLMYEFFSPGNNDFKNTSDLVAKTVKQTVSVKSGTQSTVTLLLNLSDTERQNN